MLGIISTRDSISGEFAKKLLEKVRSITSGNLSSEDEMEKNFLSETESNVSIEWK